MSKIFILKSFNKPVQTQIYRAFTTSGVVKFRMSDKSNFCPLATTPDNIEELKASQKSFHCSDRSREVSGQQTSNLFSGSFMCSQFQVESNQDQDQLGYDLDGNAHLVSVLQTNLPEPFSAVDVDLLKEGLPEGLSDFVRERGQRWAMEDRIETGHDHTSHVFF